MALRGRSNTAGDMRGNTEDSSNSSPSSANGPNPRPSGSSASSLRSLRKRHSFFGRSSSDAGRTRKPNPLYSSSPNQDSTQEQTASRPRTAFDNDQSSVRSRSKPFETIRDSFFGGRRNGPISSARERADSNTLGSALASAVPTWSREHFANKDDYDRHLTKQTISPPFNFVHVTHTARAQLPKLDTVDEKDLPGEFWSVAAHQRPRRHLNGIKADDLRRKHQQDEMSPISPISPHSRAISPIAEDGFDDRPVIPEAVENMSPLDENMFDEIAQARFELDGGAVSLKPAKQVVKHPKRYSSLNALDALAAEFPQPPNMNTFYESSSNASDDPASCTVSPNINNQPSTSRMQPQTEMEFPRLSKQVLPPLPDKRPSKNQFKQASISRSTAVPNISLVIPVQQPVSPRSKRSSRSQRSHLKSPTLSPNSDIRSSMLSYDATWEDDVDFCYEQAAESTFDFDWDVLSHPSGISTRKGSVERSGSSSYHAYSPALSSNDGGGSCFRFNGANFSSETIAERRRSRAAAAASHHKRGSSVASVGHRGFLAARKSSTDLTALASPDPAALQISPSPAPVNVLSPVFSVTGADHEAEKSPFTIDGFRFPRCDGITAENLSDPESCRNSNSSKHRKSSSYGSHESTARPLPNTAREANRWSVASVSSLPDLLHPRTKNKMFLSKTIISSPLESLPQSPPSDADTSHHESTIVPRELQTQPVRNSFVMRRPPSSGDRTILQAAGKAGSRRSSRPEAPQRMSRIIQTPDGPAVPEATKTGPQWI